MKSKPLKTRGITDYIGKNQRIYWKNKEKADRIISYYWNPCKYLTGHVKGLLFPFWKFRRLQPFSRSGVSNDFCDHWFRVNDCINSSMKSKKIFFLTESLLTHQKKDRWKSNTLLFTIYDSFAAYQNQETRISSGLIKRFLTVFLDSYRIPSSLNTKKRSRWWIKQTYYDQAGAIYAIVFDGQTLINVSFVDQRYSTDFHNKYSDQIIH